MPPKQDKLPAAKLDMIKALDHRRRAGEHRLDGQDQEASPTVDLSATAGAGQAGRARRRCPRGCRGSRSIYTPRAAAVTALAASPWAPLVAVAGQKQIVLYNSDTAQLLGVLPFPEGMPHVLKFSRSGALLLAGGGRGGQAGASCVYDVQDRQAGVRSRRRARRRAGRRHQRRPHADRPGRSAARGAHLLGGRRRAAARDSQTHRLDLRASSSAPTACCWPRPTATAACSCGKPRRPASIRTWTATRPAITDVSWRIDSNVLASAQRGRHDQAVGDGRRQGDQELGRARRRRDVARIRARRQAGLGRPRPADQAVGSQRSRDSRALPAFGDIATEVAITHDGGRVVAGDWMGEVRLSNAADGKP